jgi:serine/threonine protein kinase
MKESEISQEEYDEYSLLREQGWLHRDIKPANLVLSVEGLKLIDFNIAAKIGKAGRTFVGTREYMLPEIGIIPWSTDEDLFATAIVLYELITGNHPYPDCQPFIDTEPTDPRKYVAALKPELASLLMNATSCNPNVRYHSAKIFRRDLLALDGTYLEKSD